MDKILEFTISGLQR